jgi:hypothetical protein
MKNSFRKPAALLLCGLMLVCGLSSLAAAKADKAIQAALKQLAAADSYTYVGQSIVDITIMDESVRENDTFIIDLHSADPLQVHTSNTFDDDDGKSSYESYIVAEGNELVSYTCMGDVWVRDAAPLEESSSFEMPVSSDLSIVSGFKKSDKLYKVNGRSAYRYTATVSNETLIDMVKGLELPETFGKEEAFFEDLLKDLAPTNMIFYLDAKTGGLLRYEVDFAGLMQSLFDRLQELMAEEMKDELTEEELKELMSAQLFQVKSFKSVVVIKNVNALGKMKLPKEALNAISMEEYMAE